MRRGRPLYFLATMGAAWIGVRTMMLWPAGATLPAPLREISPVQPALASAAPAMTAAVSPIVAPRIATAAWRTPMLQAPGGVRRATMTVPGHHVAEAATLSPETGFALMPGTAASPTKSVVAAAAPVAVEAPRQIVLQPRPPAVASGDRSRWSFTSWLIARSGAGLGVSPDAPQLGGTQGGVRVDYALSRALAATARVATPAAGAGREASIGLAWRPAGIPLRFVAEQRIALDRGRGGPSVGVSGGVSEVALPARFAFESYAQAGLIFRDGTEHYADGIARATRPLFDMGNVRLDLGGGAWGGVQRGVSRFDVGPTLGARLPISGGAMRVSLDWRQRVAGNARPGSGPAISAGADF